MKPPSKKTPAKKPNLAAKALSDPKFRPKIVEKPDVYKRRPKFSQKLVETDDDDRMN
ncbi:MAG: hypothetical protein ABIQ30_16795 [Devosia sp.]